MVYQINSLFLDSFLTLFQEEAETRRLEALKMERQKRIASRGSSIPAQSSVPMQSRKQVPSKLSHLDEAKARAERLRTYKADLQKMKKEKVCCFLVHTEYSECL